MRLPNAPLARVDEEKITQYLLQPNHPTGRTKARFFSQFGFRAEQWWVFAAALRSHGARHEVVRVVDTDYGMRYSVDGTIETPDGRSPGVRTVWQVDWEDGGPRLVTAYPL